MGTQPGQAEEDAVEQCIYPDLPCHVANEDEFRAAVLEEIVSLETEPTYDYETVMAELRAIIHGRD